MPRPLHQISPGGHGTLREKDQLLVVRLRRQQHPDAQSFGGGESQDHTEHLQRGHEIAGSQDVKRCMRQGDEESARPQSVHTRTTIRSPPGTERDRVEVGLQGKTRQHAQGAFGGKGVEPSARQGLRWNLCSRLQTSEHPYGARHRR